MAGQATRPMSTPREHDQKRSLICSIHYVQVKPEMQKIIREIQGFQRNCCTISTGPGIYLVSTGPG